MAARKAAPRKKPARKKAAAKKLAKKKLAKKAGPKRATRKKGSQKKTGSRPPRPAAPTPPPDAPPADTLGENILTQAKKRRHLHLLEKLSSGKRLTRGELTELEAFEGKPLPPGVVRTKAELAEALAVNIRSVHRWDREGLPWTTDGLLNIAQVQAWRHRRAHGEENGNGNGKDALHWQSMFREMKAKLAQVELQQRIGLLIPKDEVIDEQRRQVLAVKQALLALPRALAPLLVGLEAHEISAVVTDRTREIIHSFARGYELDENLEPINPLPEQQP